MPRVQRLEVIQTGARRRWTLEEKRRIVAESDAAPRAVSATARRYGLLPGQLFSWRKLVREGRLMRPDEAVGFAQAVVACEARAAGAIAAVGRIEIVLANGVRVIVDQQVDAGALMRVVRVVAQ
jgi:transposase